MIAALALSGWCAAAAMLAELRRRRVLLADASHELRGPLTSLSLGLAALRRQPQARRRADALLTELDRMRAAADAVAAAARGRRPAPSAGATDVRALVERSSEAWRAPAAHRGGRVLVDWDAGPQRVRADPRRLAQALGNLLGNAVEHGGGDVIVRGRSEPGHVRVEIADRGRGLPIARRAVEEAGGRLESRNRPGGGRVVIAELPTEPAA